MNELTKKEENKQTFSHYSFTERAIFKGFTKNDSGTYFASLSLPTGKIDNKQSFINVNAIVSNSSALQSLASSLCDCAINDGKGTSAEVTLTNMKAVHSTDQNGQIRCNDQNVPFINYTAFLNGIAFSQAL